MQNWNRNRFTYDSGSDAPFKISRSKIELFIECPRCFYLDRVLGISRPSFPPFTLNNTVDLLLKKEFDLLRKKGESHELMKKYQIQAVPFDHPEIDTWRDNFRGKEYKHEGTNLIIFGAVDDIWVNKEGELIIVDYKSTSTEKTVTLEGEFKQGYKRQVEIYQWIFRKSGFKVNNTAYFVFANAGKNREKFDGILEFDLSIVTHDGNSSWVENKIFEIKKCLDSKKVPDSLENCQYCLYRETAGRI